MSLIAGYFCFFQAKWNDEGVSEKIRSFSIVPGDSPASYRTIVEPSRFGHIFAVYKPDAPPQIRHINNTECSVITLGFNDLSCDSGTVDVSGRSNGAAHRHSEIPGDMEKSEGEFVSMILEHDSSEVHIVNDRFASRPFYVMHRKDRVLFSSNLLFLLHLADCRQTPDPLGWLQICSYSHTLGTRTNIEGIERILPASHIVISKSGLTSRQYWRLRHDVRDDLDPVRHAEQTFDAIQKSTALRSRIVNRGFASLSGGLDSRLVAAAIPDKANFFTFTFTDSNESAESVEAAAAARVSHLLGLEHRVKRIGRDAVSNVADCLVRLTGGLIPMHHPAKTFQALREMVDDSGFQLGGGPGDVLAGAYVSSSIHNISPIMTDRQIYKFIVWRRKHSLMILRNVFRKDVLAEYFKQLDHSMQECFAALSGPTAAHRVTAWAMAFRQPAFTFTSPIHNHPDVTEASPHLGYEYSDCMLSLPATWIYRKNFYKFMIYHCIPQLRDVIYANTGSTLDERMQHFSVSRRKRICGAIERLIPAGMLENYRKHRVSSDMRKSLEYDMLRSDRKLFTELDEIMHSFPRLNEILNIEGCRKLLTHCRQGDLYGNSFSDDAELVGSIATMCYWHKNIGDFL